MLDINHIAKTFNPGLITEKRALADVDLHLAEGDFVTMIGGNGAGKSTTLNAVADFVCFHCPLVASAEANPLHNQRKVQGRKSLVQHKEVESYDSH